jgi:hypothetical protein
MNMKSLHGETRNPYRISVGKTFAKRTLGSYWEESRKMNIRESHVVTMEHK